MKVAVVLTAIAIVVASALRLGESAVEDEADVDSIEEVSIATISAKLHEAQAELQIERAESSNDLLDACVCHGVSYECKVRSMLQGIGAALNSDSWAGWADVQIREFCNLEAEKHELEQAVASIMDLVSASGTLASEAGLNQRVTSLKSKAEAFKKKVNEELPGFESKAAASPPFGLTQDNLLEEAHRDKATYLHLQGLWKIADSLTASIEKHLDKAQAQLIGALEQAIKRGSIPELDKAKREANQASQLEVPWELIVQAEMRTKALNWLKGELHSGNALLETDQGKLSAAQIKLGAVNVAIRALNARKQQIASELTAIPADLQTVNNFKATLDELSPLIVSLNEAKTLAVNELAPIEADLIRIDELHSKLGEDAIARFYQSPSVTKNDNEVLRRVVEAKGALDNLNVRLEFVNLDATKMQGMLNALALGTTGAIENIGGV